MDLAPVVFGRGGGEVFRGDQDVLALGGLHISPQFGNVSLPIENKLMTKIVRITVEHGMGKVTLRSLSMKVVAALTRIIPSVLQQSSAIFEEKMLDRR
jgi:hypothetical protein